MTQPNILFLFTDQQTMSAMSAAGNPHVSTPHMDSIAANGVRFEKSYCTSPVCCPSRSSLVSGRMPHETGVNNNFQRMDKSIPTMGEVFRAAGYDTGWAGKWHVLEPFVIDDVQVPGFEALPFEHDERRNIGQGSVSDGPTIDKAIEFVRRDRDRPFLLGVSLHNPHDICSWIMQDAPTAETIDDLPPLPDNFAIDPDEPEFIRECRARDHCGNELNWTTDWDEAKWRTYLHAYYRYTEEVDAEIGRLLAALREEGLEEDTLIIFTSDHGEGIAAHQWVVKLMIYDEPATVPFIVSWKGVTPAGVTDSDHLVSGVDALPTLCDYAGVPVPEGIDNASGAGGTSLRPVIEDPSLPGRDFLVTELEPDNKKPEMKARMIRTKRYKYAAFSTGADPESLYDMSFDPGEMRNLVDDPAAVPILQEHRERLRNWIAATDDIFRFPEGLS